MKPRLRYTEVFPAGARGRVKRRFPNAGAELSSMWGWRIMDYTDQQNPKPLNKGNKTEKAAWYSVFNRLCR